MGNYGIIYTMGADNFAGFNDAKYNQVLQIEEKKHANKWGEWVDKNRSRFPGIFVVFFPPINANGMSGIVNEDGMQFMKDVTLHPHKYTKQFKAAGLTRMPQTADEWNKLLHDRQKE